MTPEVEIRRRFIDDLYYELLARGIAYFLPDFKFTAAGRAPRADPLRLEVAETTRGRWNCIGWKPVTCCLTPREPSPISNSA